MVASKSVPVLILVKRLCDALAQQKINYCHWKSNAALDRSACGKNDLDLLVDRADAQAFLAILFQLGFKASHSPADFITPGIHNYYGCDPAAQTIVNVHVHFHLILGHDLTKNYHLPVERAYLASSTQEELFRIPAPEFELILLVLRLVIKHFTWDTFLLGHGKLSSSEQNELDYLRRKVTVSRLAAVLVEDFPFIDSSAFNTCLERISTSASAWQRWRTGERLIACLDAFARHSRVADACLKFWRRFKWPLQRRLLGKDFRKQFRNGGLVAAIVGGDGAGKTTAVDGVINWLSGDFSVRKYHMGKPKWSSLTVLVRGLIKIGTFLHLYPFERAEIEYTDDPSRLIFPGYPWMFREVCTARDRFLTYRQAVRWAAKGGVVILDRFPLPQIKFMDGPQVSRMTAGIPSNHLIRAMVRLEEGYYGRILPPDLLMVLLVDPQIAVARKIDELEKNVCARSGEIWRIDWSQTSAQVIDASQSKEAVLGAVKDQVWARL